MKFLDLTLPSPAENVACDEALLDWCDDGAGAPTLRVWESPCPFVVVGYGEDVSREVNQAACLRDGVPILRRCSGGGSVLQGPGCLNYALVLDTESSTSLLSITATNCFVMRRHQQALVTLTGLPIQIQGFTDLTLHHRKFSGNSQRRKRRHLLFHGTFLIAADLGLMGRYLHQPSRLPDYREGRDHRNFLTQLSVPANTLKAALRATWEAEDPLTGAPEPFLSKLVDSKYSQEAWNLRRKVAQASSPAG